MTVEVEVQVAVEGVTLPSTHLITEWAQATFSLETKGELTVRIVSRDEVVQLNHDFRQIDKATNVLSFSSDWQIAGELPYHGDIAICAAVVAEEAEQQHKTLHAHWAHMVVHGALHLQGYDHQDDDEAKEMESCEIALLAQWGFANPYATDGSNI